MTPLAMPTLVADQLCTIRSLVACAFMACDAIDDSEQCDALQTLLAQVEHLVREAEAQVSTPHHP